MLASSTVTVSLPGNGKGVLIELLALALFSAALRDPKTAAMSQPIISPGVIIHSNISDWAAYSIIRFASSRIRKPLATAASAEAVTASRYSSLSA